MGRNTEKMVAMRKEKSETLITNVKLLVEFLYENDIPITKAEIMRHVTISRSTLDKNPILSSYIKEMQEKQNRKKPSDIKTYNRTAIYRKLMASYVFTYQLLEEQNIFLEDAIKSMEQQIDDLKNN